MSEGDPTQKTERRVAFKFDDDQQTLRGLTIMDALAAEGSIDYDLASPTSIVLNGYDAQKFEDRLNDQ